MSETSGRPPDDQGLPIVEEVAEAVFDLLSHLAVNINTTIDEDLVGSFGQRHGVDVDDMVVHTTEGPWSLLDIFDLGTKAPADAVEGVNALFAHGLAIRLGPLESIDRRRLLGRVVGLLPGIERLGAFSPTAHLEATCEPDDLVAFWEAYTDRLLVELNKRAILEKDEGAHPWLLTRMLEMNTRRIDHRHGAAWPQLMRHVVRLMDQGEPRAEVVQRFITGCEEDEVLAFLSRSPAVSGAPNLISTLLVSGERAVVSCGVLALHSYPALYEEADFALEMLSAMPFEEAAPQLLDLCGQLHHLPEPRGASKRLLEGVLQLIVGGVLQAGDSDALKTAISGDARAFTEAYSFIRIDDTIGKEHPEISGPLLEQMCSVFYQSFTPSGLRHTYCDRRWLDAVSRAFARLIKADPEGTLARVGSFGLALESQASRWIAGDDREARAHRRALACSFLGLFADVIGGAARRLYQAGVRRPALATYGVLIRVYRAHERLARGSGMFGALEYLWNDRGGESDQSQIEHDALKLAEVEEALWPPVTEPEEAPVRMGNWSVPSNMVAAHGAMSGRAWPGTTGAEVEASGRLIGRPGGYWRTVWGIYSGWDLLRESTRGLGRLLGLRRRAWITLSDAHVKISEELTWGRRQITHREHISSLSALEAVQAQRQMRWPYAAAGLVSLLAAGMLGGYLVFLGMRTGLNWITGVGAGCLALGVLADVGWSALFRRHKGHVTLALRSKTAPHWTRMMVEVDEAAPIFDGLMARGVKALIGGAPVKAGSKTAQDT
ncbi:MAG: hypothetical protein ACE366_19660 [Bradymonadia bacterium]